MIEGRRGKGVEEASGEGCKAAGWRVGSRGARAPGSAGERGKANTGDRKEGPPPKCVWVRASIRQTGEVLLNNPPSGRVQHLLAETAAGRKHTAGRHIPLPQYPPPIDR